MCKALYLRRKNQYLGIFNAKGLLIETATIIAHGSAMRRLQGLSKQSPVRAARLSFIGDINKRLVLLFPFLFLFFAIKKKKKRKPKKKKKERFVASPHIVFKRKKHIQLRNY
jgi:hypothetical protein